MTTRHADPLASDGAEPTQWDRVPPGQLVQSHKCLPGEADDESRLTLTEQYTGLPVNQPFS